MTKILVADDQAMVRLGLRTILGVKMPDAEIFEAADGLASLAAVKKDSPDLVLLDIRMPGIDGVEVTRRLRATHPAHELRILILTTFDEDRNVIEAIRGGANGFLSKAAGPDELMAAIHEVLDGGGALSANASKALIDYVAAGRKSAAPEANPGAAALFDELTARELEIVRLLVAGKTNAQIARELFLSPFTVKTHLNHAMTKIGVSERAQLVSEAVRAGIYPE
jgi:DNA-binding NarL/FixJ family response regulator